MVFAHSSSAMVKMPGVYQAFTSLVRSFVPRGRIDHLKIAWRPASVTS